MMTVTRTCVFLSQAQQRQQYEKLLQQQEKKFEKQKAALRKSMAQSTKAFGADKLVRAKAAATGLSVSVSECNCVQL